MKHLLPVLPFVCTQGKLRFSVVGPLFLGLSVFSLSGMEKVLDLNLLYECKYYDREPKRIYDLLEAGADPNTNDGDGYTPLGRLAAFLKLAKNDRNFNLELYQFEAVIETLLRHGAEIHKTQNVYNELTNKSVEISDYDMLKPLIPDLDTIIKKVEVKKKPKKFAADLKKAFENKLRANQSINIKGQTFDLHKEILSTRCPSLSLQLPFYKNEGLVITEID
jgi:hypothetical protein